MSLHPTGLSCHGICGKASPIIVLVPLINASLSLETDNTTNPDRRDYNPNPATFTWWDPIAIWHSRSSTNLGFADGHTWLRPEDHPWRLALWFSWKYINGLNCWEPDTKTGKSEGLTQIENINIETQDDFSANIAMTINYSPPGVPPVLTEKRNLRISRPDAQGAYIIDWQSTFTAADKDVLLDRTPIHGEPKGVAILDHPQNLRSPTPWYLAKSITYFSPAPLFNEPLRLKARQAITLKYRIVVHSQKLNPEKLNTLWTNHQYSSIFVRSKGSMLHETADNL